MQPSNLCSIYPPISARIHKSPLLVAVRKCSTQSKRSPRRPQRSPCRSWRPQWLQIRQAMWNGSLSSLCTQTSFVTRRRHLPQWVSLETSRQTVIQLTVEKLSQDQKLSSPTNDNNNNNNCNNSSNNNIRGTNNSADMRIDLWNYLLNFPHLAVFYFSVAGSWTFQMIVFGVKHVGPLSRL